MKQVYLFILLLINCFSIKAQYTITPLQKPDIGDSHNFIWLDTANIINGSSGANQIWNYTNLILPATPTINSTFYSDATTIPNYSLYPGAYMAIIAPGGSFTSYDSDPNNLNVNWIYRSMINYLCTKYIDPLTRYHYPISYNSVFHDSAKFLAYNQHPPSPGNIGIYPEYGVLSYTCNGYGTLDLPNGVSYPNTLKLNTLYAKTYFDEITLAPMGYDTTYIEEYFNSASKFPILSYSKTFGIYIAGGSTTPNYSKSIQLNAHSITGINEYTNNSYISIFPNPACNLINVNIHKQELSTSPSFIIRNSLGNSFKTEAKQMNNQNYQIDLKDYAPGIYFLTVYSEKGQVTKKILVE